MKKLICLVGAVAAALPLAAARPNVTPSLKEWKDGEGAPFKVTERTRVVTDAGAPAGLAAYAKAFAKELGVACASGKPAAGDIHLALVKDASLGREGYTFESAGGSVRVTAATPLGAYWATRSIRQSLDRDGELPSGTARDWPDYPVRGFLFDCGRKPFALSTLRTIVDICSYYKINDLQLHLSDNYIWLHKYPGVKTAQDMLAFEPTAGGFRLESKVKGLASTDIAYTKKDFHALVNYARTKGVKIVPELDVPGHALQFVRARPDLMYKGSVGKHQDLERAAMLDLTNPATFPFVAKVFDEYIDDGTFANNIVHIGTDEYYGDAESYRAFADKMLRHIRSKGKTPRLWGSLTKKNGKTPVTCDGVEMHIWSMQWQNPVEAVKAGYKIINILDSYTYSVPNGTGNVGAYCDDIDSRRLYTQWNPRVFPKTNPSALGDKVLGGAWAMWNDNSFMTDPGLCGRDLLPRIAKNCAAVAQRTWTEASPDVSYDDFLASVRKDAPRLGADEPRAWSRSFKTAKTKKPLLVTDELTLYAASPVNGKAGFMREGAHYTFDYAVPSGKTVTLEFASAGRKATLKADGVAVGGTPVRQHFPESCKFFTLPEPR